MWADNFVKYHFRGILLFSYYKKRKYHMLILQEQLNGLLLLPICTDEVRSHWRDRLQDDRLTRDEYNKSHFSIYFLPYDIITKKVFIVHHKKSGLWIFPGGHIDKGEVLMETLNREIEEELGVINKIKEEIQPFLLTITPINNITQPCKEHLDIWYRIMTDGSEFNVDPKEFHETRWVSIDEARKVITDPPNIEALNRMEQLFS